MQALRLSPEHFTTFKKNPKDPNEKGVTICLGCTGPQDHTIPAAQTGGKPVKLTIHPATDEQLRTLFERKHPLLEEYETNDPVDSAPKVLSAPPEKEAPTTGKKG